MVPLFSTAYFPPVAYVAALSRHSHAAIECKETFPKQTYRNRMLIMTAGGVRALTVPVVRGNHSRTDEVAIDYHMPWNVVHMRTLTAAYAASPFFLYYSDDLEALLSVRYGRLIELNMAVTKWLLKKMGISCTLKATADYVPAADVPMDYRNAFSPKRQYEGMVFPSYYQVFADRIPFTPNLSAVDLLMNLGPEAKTYVESLNSHCKQDEG